jgi:ferrous iron transport protein B
LTSRPSDPAIAPTKPDSAPAREARSATPVTIALLGNPNTGKTALFNALTGFRRHVANYPGVTVEVARGPIRGTPRLFELLDLPGTYSLQAGSPDEQVALDALLGQTAGYERRRRAGAGNRDR